jgi:hypothetical protein
VGLYEYTSISDSRQMRRRRRHSTFTDLSVRFSCGCEKIKLK